MSNDHGDEKEFDQLFIEATPKRERTDYDHWLRVFMESGKESVKLRETFDEKRIKSVYSALHNRVWDRKNKTAKMPIAVRTENIGTEEKPKYAIYLVLGPGYRV